MEAIERFEGKRTGRESDLRAGGTGQPGTALACHGVTKRFGGLTAVSDLTLEVSRGKIFGLLGPNGAGKTTLIRMMLGLLSPSTGTIEVLGERVPSETILPRVGYMPQSLALYTDLKVRQNLELFGRLYGLSNALLQKRMAKVLELVHLSDRGKALVSELSGGMQRRVSLAAALLADPDLLLLDEPTVGVDPQLRAEFWDHFRGLAREGRTIVMTTHYMEESSQCDEVALLHQGRVLVCDAPARVKEVAGAATMDDAFLALVRDRTRNGGK